MPHASDAANHVPVLLAESIAALDVQPDGTYVDGTFGRGGHSRAILAALSGHGRLVAIDRDPQAEAAAGAIADPRFTFRRARYSEMREVLAGLAIDRVDGVLLDLGVSSPQLEDPSRGFTFRFDGPLDMRMDPTRGESAAEFIARASIDELTEVIRNYGEERFAQSVARAIAKAREVRPIVSTRQLADVVAQAIGARTRGDWRQDPAARTFQALRIAVNRELDELSAALPAVVPLLASGGRLAVISFHSLEDRIVKRFIAWASRPFGGDSRLARMAIREQALPPTPLVAIGRAIKPSEREIAANPRARSAVLRVAQRTPSALPASWPRGFAMELQ
ncbi:MAG TPA: 16S rRNA (cytosine(1402)-N(4))-methyltransferase RsmH [Casimicrobiaceae bacterium]|nr:16S rRNA (cytosine(1402)-N(4))-methyltransferase RsmH [Casimicrobiaceae bacterium]